jgi:D-alanyl-D-alanine carboxypeptidase
VQIIVQRKRSQFGGPCAAPLFQNWLNPAKKDERPGYHKRIGNAVALRVTGSEAGTFAASGANENSKGVTVRQAFAAIAYPIASPLKSAIVALLAIAMGIALAGSATANSKYAAIVVDANTGKTLFSSSADSRRYPASLTKMMTLYLVFEAMAAGKVTKKTSIPISRNAAAEPPTKLGVKAGKSITIETAILSLVTKSANDASTAVAEYLGGSEKEFARMMTAKARRLGMNSTVFRNAHGLPDTAQFSTARDLATLGIALKEHYPQYYHYFSTRSFTYGRTRMANHNRLLGRVKGVDGIKTGYTRASGFNLVSSVSQGERRIVAVVMGGTSGASRDKHMAELIRKYMPKASTKGKAAPLIASAGGSPISALAKVFLPKNDAPTPVARPEEDVVVADTEIEPEAAAVAADITPSPKPKSMFVETLESAPMEQAYAAPSPERFGGDIDPVETAAVAPSGWAIQVASSPSKSEAAAVLAKTTSAAPAVLAHASGYTVTFDKDGVTYHRARFGGFGSKDAAWKACKALKRKKIDCYAVEN